VRVGRIFDWVFCKPFFQLLNDEIFDHGAHGDHRGDVRECLMFLRRLLVLEERD
jgi:hypothetical protein